MDRYHKYDIMFRRHGDYIVYVSFDGEQWNAHSWWLIPGTEDND